MRLALLLLSACAAPSALPIVEEPPPEPADLAAVSGGKSIGPAGGRVSVGPVTLEFPEGALTETVRITVTPVRPGGEVEPGDARVPTEPPPAAPVLVGPANLMLRRPVKVSFATASDAPQAVARVAILPPQPSAWMPLSGQGRSPSLFWAQSPYLGVFAVVPVSCCEVSDVATCSTRCDVGALRYRCDAAPGRTGCCDPYARTPRTGGDLLCAK